MNTTTSNRATHTPRPPLREIRGFTVSLPQANVDTDRIIPARFLTTTVREGLGRHLFADWRFDASGTPRPEFPLHRPEAEGATVLVAGENFGCGSSREHAVWALADYGFRAVVSVLVRGHLPPERAQERARPRGRAVRRAPPPPRPRPGSRSRSTSPPPSCASRTGRPAASRSIPSRGIAS